MTGRIPSEDEHRDQITCIVKRALRTKWHKEAGKLK